MHIIPTPAKCKIDTGYYTLTYDRYVILDKSCSILTAERAALFVQKMKEILGYAPMLSRGVGRSGDIVIVEESYTKHKEEENGTQELKENTVTSGVMQGYALEIVKKGVTLRGSAVGLWHGMQTLLQIAAQSGSCFPCLQIEDIPVISDRGFYFDCTRGRVPKLSWLKELADKMAYYKLNQLQLYVEHTYLFRDFSEVWRDDTPLTAAEIMELDRYCAVRGIELVPSLATFGHMHKILSTSQFEHLAELESAHDMPFSAVTRAFHHTINAVDPESLMLVKKMLLEYMPLFSSDKVNICADETFDLGKGRSKEHTEKKGKARVYVDYLKALAEFVVEQGKTPMFWGDIIGESIELARELPKESIFLNWGYEWDIPEKYAKKFAEVGVKQYCCPGCLSWGTLIPLNWYAFYNISNQCAYARKYGAGLLNTAWGDYLHPCQPDFTAVGMIYGAQMSWSAEKISLEDMNERISAVEYMDKEEKLVGIMTRLHEKDFFNWAMATYFYEHKTGVLEEQVTERYMSKIADNAERMQKVDENDAEMQEIINALYHQLRYVKSAKREEITDYIVSVEGVRLMNQVGKILYHREYGVEYDVLPNKETIASELERWLYYYKISYRKDSLECELRRLEEMICWYADYIRM